MESTESSVVRQVSRSDQPEWLRLRAITWPELSATAHHEQMEGVYTTPCDYYRVFVITTEDGKLAGFIEASIGQYQLADSLITYLLIEGLGLDEYLATASTNVELHQAAEMWGRKQHCTEVQVVQLNDNPSVDFYLRLGYSIKETTVKLRKIFSHDYMNCAS